MSASLWHHTKGTTREKRIIPLHKQEPQRYTLSSDVSDEKAEISIVCQSVNNVTMPFLLIQRLFQVIVQEYEGCNIKSKSLPQEEKKR